MKRKLSSFLLLLLGGVSVLISSGPNSPIGLEPYENNPFYWQYKGKPVILIGGSVEDNLYQLDTVEEHLDLLAACGGNYVRCSISCRDEGNEWWFAQDPENGLFDLSRPNPQHWDRFEKFLQLTEKRDIIVQIEMWDRHDFAEHSWPGNPYNPRNNINYSEEESGLPASVSDSIYSWAAFFETVPERNNNRQVLKYQLEQVDQLLSISLKYGHVLYCMDNESSQSEEWSRFWAKHVRRRADEKGVKVMITEMWNQHDLNHDQHLRTLDHPELYDFIDVSQNNHKYHREHWNNLQAYRQKVIDSGIIRPLTSVKIYGDNRKAYGSTRDAQERFWRLILGGTASARFHRPVWGIGLNEIAQSNIKSMHMALGEHDFFKARPARDLLRNCSRNEAYCSAVPGASYLLYFPDGGNVLLNTEDCDSDTFSVRFIDIRNASWQGVPIRQQSIDGRLTIATPDEEGYWAAIVQPI